MDHTTTLNKYLWAQNTISLYIFEQIFGEMAIHIFNKWENSNGNFLNFMTFYSKETGLFFTESPITF